MDGAVSVDTNSNSASASASRGSASPRTDQRAIFDFVSPHYFDTLGATMRQGRDFTDADNRADSDAVIVNERLVEQLFGRLDAATLADALGRTIRYGRQSRRAQIIGIVSDTHLDDIREPARAVMYLPIGSRAAGGFELMVRTQQPAGLAIEQLRRALHDIDPQLPLVRAWTFEQEMANALSKEQMIASVATTFGTLALALVAIGVFGALSYAVARRSRELAIRVALGATPTTLRSLVLRESLTVAILGLGAGLPMAWLTARTLASLLHGVHPLDPATLTTVAILMVSVTTLAAYLPARRAARTDPIAALRAE
jgi:hypothetical protein